MMRYENIDFVLGCYFTIDNELSEEQGIEALREHLAANPEFAVELREEVQQALGDPAYSWRDAFETNNVVSIADEKRARQYAEKLLGVVLSQ
jgi:hypothetical protein